MKVALPQRRGLEVPQSGETPKPAPQPLANPNPGFATLRFFCFGKKKPRALQCKGQSQLSRAGTSPSAWARGSGTPTLQANQGLGGAHNPPPLAVQNKQSFFPREKRTQNTVHFIFLFVLVCLHRIGVEPI